MTAEEAFNYTMNRYALMYNSTTVQEARTKFFDHTFNTIGNGYRTFDDFAESFQWTPKMASMTQSFPAKYIGDHQLYMGYTAMRDGEDPAVSHRVDPDSDLHGLYTQEEQGLHPNVVRWIAVRSQKQEPFAPYPNFKKEYSPVYKLELSKLDDTWLHAGVEYYQQAQAFFKGPNAEYYSGAWPSDPKKQAALIKDFESGFARTIQGIADPQEQWKAISKAYNQPYDGDTPAFIQAKWAKEQTRIQTFIASTIGMLENELASRREFSAGHEGP